MTPHRFKRPCLDCGVLSTDDRCPEHKKRIETIRNRRKKESPQRTAIKRQRYGNPQYRKQAKFIRDTATNCHICGEGYRHGDPWQADHLIPGDLHSPLAPAHRSCNARRGNKPLQRPNHPPATT